MWSNFGITRVVKTTHLSKLDIEENQNVVEFWQHSFSENDPSVKVRHWGKPECGSISATLVWWKRTLSKLDIEENQNVVQFRQHSCGENDPSVKVRHLRKTRMWSIFGQHSWSENDPPVKVRHWGIPECGPFSGNTRVVKTTLLSKLDIEENQNVVQFWQHSCGENDPSVNVIEENQIWFNFGNTRVVKTNPLSKLDIEDRDWGIPECGPFSGNTRVVKTTPSVNICLLQTCIIVSVRLQLSVGSCLSMDVPLSHSSRYQRPASASGID